MKTHCQPGTLLSPDDLPPHTIALDGVVQGPFIDNENRRYSFDHHGDCIRHCTTATCRQVLDAVLLGLDPTGMDVLVNDIDGDTVLSVWLLGHHSLWIGDPAALAKVRPLVEVVDLGDAFGPTYPLPGEGLADTFHRRVLAPWREARKRGESMAPSHLEACIEALEEWWSAGLVPMEWEEARTSEVTIQEQPGWVFAMTDGSAAGEDLRLAVHLYRLGHDRLVLAAPLSNSDCFRYTLVKRSDFVAGFNVPHLLRLLDRAESTRFGEGGWGGASTIGGSPRPLGSRLVPSEVCQIVAAALNA